uniref:9.2kDa peptide n=1 Tax=Aggregatibacter actinomycetemcomitans TaxID=714 RepID=Q43894_AGGAC|nr:9.2kDa peptide [Aggregatibacter actinomycetemcomitans]
MSSTGYAPFYLRFIQFPSNEVLLYEYWKLVQNFVQKVSKITVRLAQIVGILGEKTIWKYQSTFNDGMLDIVVWLSYSK